MKSAAIYARVSTQNQVESETMTSQMAQLEHYARQEGYQIAPEHRFVDEAVSGKSLHRPGLSRLRDSALTGVFTTLLCLSPDRLSRNLGVQQFLLAEWQALGIEVIFLNRPRPAQSAHDTLLLNIEGAFAEYERTIINDRMQRGRRHRLRQGLSAPYPAPYGYHFLPATLYRGSSWEIDPAQALVVKQIFCWYTQANLTIKEIVTRLNDQKIPAPSGGQWHYATVRHILSQPAYTGTAYYGRKQRDNASVGLPRRSGQGRVQFPRQKPRPADEWIPIAVPVLVEASLWQQAQEKRALNAKMAARNGRRTYLLRGLLVCGVCHRLLQGRCEQGHIYYRCPHGGKRRPSHVPQHTCSIRADVVEAQVWQALADLLHQPQLIRDAWQAHRQTQTQPTSQVDRWQRRQQQLQGQRQRLLDAYQGGVLSLDELTQRQNPLFLELRELETRLAAAATVATTDISLQHFTAHIERALHAPDVKTQQDVIRLLIEQIVVSDNELIIEHIIPTVVDCQLEPTHCSVPAHEDS